MAHSVLLLHWCLWVGGSLRSWNRTGIAKHLYVSAWQNLAVPVLANRPVLAEAFLVVKVHLQLIKGMKGRQDKAEVPCWQPIVSA